MIFVAGAFFVSMYLTFSLRVQISDLDIKPKNKVLVPGTLKNHPRIINFKGPLINFSSTQIRNRIRENKEIKRLVPIKVYSYIRKRKIYL